MCAPRFAAALTLVSLFALPSPRAAAAPQQEPTREAGATALNRAPAASNEALKKVIIYGSVGAIAGALGSLRVRRAPDASDDERGR